MSQSVIYGSSYGRTKASNMTSSTFPKIQDSNAAKMEASTPTPAKQQPSAMNTGVATSTPKTQEPRSIKLRGDIETEFKLFDKSIDTVYKQLKELVSKAHELQVGGSVAISPISARMSETLNSIRWLYRNNADALFPTKSFVKSDPNDLVEQLRNFAEDIQKLLSCFSEFPTYEHNVTYQDSFTELLHWTPSLVKLQDKFNHVNNERRTVRSFLYDMKGDVTKKLELLERDVIRHLIDVGVLRIQVFQTSSIADLSNVSTIAGLFASATATMLQYSYMFGGITPGRLPSAVTVLWFTSLVLSIAAATNSVIGQSWTKTIFRSPDYHPSRWTSFWMDRSSITLLIISVSFFFVGLALFAYISHQTLVVSTIIAALSGATCCSLAAMSASFISKTRALNQWAEGKRKARPLIEWWFYLLAKVDSIVRSVVCWREERRHSMNIQDPESHAEEQRTIISLLASFTIKTSLTPSSSAPSKNEAQENWRRVFDKLKLTYALSHVTDSGLPFATPKFDEDLKRVLAQIKVVQTHNVHEAKIKWLQFSPAGTCLATTSLDRKSILISLEPRTANLQETRTTFYHSSSSGQSVHKVEWSPNGENLLQLKRDGGVSVWNKEGHLMTTRSRYPIDSLVYSASWRSQESFVSIEGSTLVESKDDNNWMRSGQLIKKCNRRDIDDFEVHDISVTKGGNWMVCVGKHNDTEHVNEIRLYDLKHDDVAPYRVPVYHEARHVTLTADDKHALISYKDKAPPQLWDLVLHSGAVVPPQRPRGDAASDPKDKKFGVPDVLTLSHRYTYIAKPRNGFASVPGVFGGPNECLVLCAGKAGYPPPTATNKAPAPKGDATEDTPNVTPGEIFCWDRDTATLIHRLAFPYEYGFLTSLAWNPAPNTWMLVTGTHNGAIQIWSTDIEMNGAVFPHKRVVESPQSTLGSPITTRTPTAGIPRHRSRFTTSGDPMSVSAGGSKANPK